MPGFQGDFSSQYVDADSPQLSTSRGRVEEAADWAVGSSVLVFPGYYTNEYVYIYNKDLTITSTEGPGQTVLDHTGAFGATFYVELNGLSYGGNGFAVRIGEVLVADAGAATGGSATNLTETGADFVAAGVQMGDTLNNDTDGSSAIITGVSTDTLTFDALYGGTCLAVQTGDLYRVRGPRGFTITGPTYDGIAWGGGVEYGSSLTIEGNVIDVGLGDGIAGNNTVRHDSHVVVRENQIINNGYAGIDISTVKFLSGITVENNLIYGNGYQGISLTYLEDESTLSVADNVISDNGHEGLNVEYVTGGSAVGVLRNTIGEYRDRGMDLGGNGYNGINVHDIDDGSSVQIGGPVSAEGNLISGYYYYGIEAADNGALRHNSDVTIRHTTVGGWLNNVGASSTDDSLMDDKATTMTDSTADFNAMGVKAGDRLYNLTNGSWSDITVVATNTLTFTTGTGGVLEPDGPDSTDDSGIDNKTTYLTDSTPDFVAAGVQAGHILFNLSDASSTAVITDRTANTLLFDGGLSGGVGNNFDDGDAYQIAFHLNGNGSGGIDLYRIDYGSTVDIWDNVVTENLGIGVRLSRIGCDFCEESSYYDDFLTYGTTVVNLDGNIVGAHQYAEEVTSIGV